MKAFQTMAAAAMLVASGLALHTVHAQQHPGLSRTDVVQHDLSIDGREVIQTRVDFAPKAVSLRHSHPGEEIAYVLEGTLEYEVARR